MAASTQIIRDRMAYVVICDHSGGAYLPEQNVSELDRKTVVSLIASGEFDNVKQVLECNPIEGICRDCTDDVMTEAAFAIIKDTAYDDLSDWQRDFVGDYAQGALAAHRNECRAEDAHRRSLMGAL